MARRVSCVLAIALACAVAAHAQSPATLHLTGNAAVDFFGSADPLAPKEWSGIDSLPAMNVPASSMDEKSPWLAGALSLAVPGAGEVYSGNYLKGALFFVAEAASWIVAYSYDKKGDNQTSLFQNFANQHWSPVRYIDWTRANLALLNPYTPHDSGYYGRAIYGEDYADDPPTPQNCRPPYRDCINWAAMNAMESDVAAGQTNGYTHQLPSWDEQQYYELIGKYAQFYSGWDDGAIDVRPSDFRPPTESRYVQYSRMRAQANDYYDVASTFVSIAVINHIVSAVDAFWSATRFNSSLHAEVRVRPQASPIGIVPFTEAKIRYNF